MWGQLELLTLRTPLLTSPCTNTLSDLQKNIQVSIHPEFSPPLISPPVSGDNESFRTFPPLEQFLEGWLEDQMEFISQHLIYLTSAVAELGGRMLTQAHKNFANLVLRVSYHSQLNPSFGGANFIPPI